MRRVLRLITDRRKLAERLHQKIGAYAPQIAELRERLLAPGLRDGESLPDSELETVLLLRLLDRRLAELEEAEDRRWHAALDLRRERGARDRTAARLNREIQALRRKLEAARGRGGAAEVLQLTGRTRRRAQWVHAQGKWVVAALGGRLGARDGDEAPEDAAAAAERIRAAGVGDAETAEWLAMVEPPFRKLDRLLVKTDRLEPVVDKLRFNRDLACAEFDHVARQLAAIARDYALLVKEERGAEEIRRAGRQPKRPGPKKRK